ncbi:MAG: hypothetical protein GF350_04015 [Chitinivibrionales bacterium]|nr:hypothetical protein [Chitinivibrionales bacterium]
MTTHSLIAKTSWALLCMLSVISGEMTTRIDAAVGYFILPENVRGFVEEGFDEAARGNVYVTRNVSSGGYSDISYQYSHDFATRMRPNAGFSISPVFFLNNGFGFGFEGAGGFSIDDVSATNTSADSLGRDSYSPVPHAYRTKTTTSHDQVYAKYRYFGGTLAFRRPFLKKSRLRFNLTAGGGSYLAVFRIEETGGTLQYHQSNGTIVLSEPYGPGFYSFGIRYHSFVVKPALALERHLTRQISLCGGFSWPVSYIEKAYKWSESSGTDYDILFFPGNRFVAGNPLLSCGVTVHFQK